MAFISNSSAPQQKRKFGPGRSALRKAVQDRGKRIHNLWYHYSPRLKQDVILRCDAAFLHFCLLEADPTVVCYELDPNPIAVVLANRSLEVNFDARVEFRNAQPELRIVGPADAALDEAGRQKRAAEEAAAARSGFKFATVTAELLNAHALLIRNWRCALAYQAACRDAMLAAYTQELVEVARIRRRCSIGELLQETNPELRAEYLAALFSAIQNAELGSDIAEKPLCLNTEIWIAGVAHA